MKKVFFLTIILLLSCVSACWARSTDEIDFQKELILCEEILKNETNTNMPEIVDYSVEIFKKAPNSLASYYDVGCVAFASSIMEINEKLKTIFKDLYDKYFDSLNDANSDIISKIVLSQFLFSGYSINEMNETEMELSYQKGKESLQNIQKNCKNKNYSALAALFLITRLSNEETLINCEQFIKYYPDHKAIPLIEAKIINEKYYFSTETKDYSECIKNLKILVEKYQYINSPHGNYKLVLDFYVYIIRSYIKLKDKDNAQKYLELIKNEAKNYYRLKQIESEVKNSNY